MIKHILYISLLICSSTTIIAQNNAIFGGGNADGYNKDNYIQALPLTVDFGGGSNDGYSKNCYQQTIPTTVAFYGGSDDGYSKDCYTQQSNLNNIFSGGIGGDGMLNSCANEPLGCFLTINLGNDTTFCEGETLTLDAGSFPGGAAYLWQDSTTTAPTFLADTSGLYYVYVTDTAGCSGVDSIIVTVNPQPTVNLGNDTSFCIGGILVLDAQNIGATYQWQNGGSSPFLNQTFTASSTGQYFVNVSFGSCSDSDTINIMVNPIVTTNYSDSIICSGDSALILGNYETVAGIYRDTIIASTGCDSILVQQLIVNSTYNQTLSTVTICSGDSALILGNYETVAAIYSDTLNTINGCDSIVSQTLNVSPSHPVNLGNNTALCVGNSLTLDAGAGATSYRWQNGATAPFLNQTFTVSTAGTYNVVTTLGACTTTDTINVTVNPNQTTNLTDSIICQGDSALIFGNYEFTVGTYYDTLNTYLGCDSILSQQLIINPTYNQNLGAINICPGDSALILGNYEMIAGTYTDTLSTLNGCDSIVSQTLNVLSISGINLGNDTSICPGNTIVLDAGSGATSYLWQNNATPPFQNQTLTVDTPGLYFVTIGLGACFASDTINVTVIPYNTNTLPTIFVCEGDSALIFGVYQTVAGMYQDTVVGGVSCDTIVSQELSYNISGMLDLGNDSTICQNESIVLDAGTNITSYMWNTGDTSQTIMVDANLLTTGLYIYFVEGTGINGCQITDSVEITVSVCTGINEIGKVNYSLFPNPAKGWVNIISDETIKSIEFYNVIGELVMNKLLMKKTTKFNIADFSKGIYMVRIVYDEKIEISKLILK